MMKYTRITAVGLILAIIPLAQAQKDDGADVYSVLRAELSIEKTIFFPSQPIQVRFTLFNPTDQCIELPAFEAADGVALPSSIILGDEYHPSLWISYDEGPPMAVAATIDVEQQKGEALKLAPHGAVGAQLDLNDLYRQVRYAGDYRLEWKPLGGAVGPVEATFRVETRKDAILVTDHGKITFSLLYDKAPRNVENFIGLVRDKFYDQKPIHRIIPNFIIQGGSPDGTSKGVHPDGRRVAAEFSDAPFEAGTLAMARKPSDPDSASCQFFVTLDRLPNLDGQFTVIGRASDAESLRTLRLLAELPTDDKNRPIRPLSIRVFTLVEAPLDTRSEELGFRRP